MATPTNTPVVKQIQDSAGALHDIAALYLVDSNGNFYSPEDVLSAGVDYTVAASLPTASASYKGKIYLIADGSDVEGGSYIEYICVNTSGSNWSWEPIGTTKIKVSVASVSSEKPNVTVKYDKATGATTSSDGGATINGSSFNFEGTSATITVPAHSHTIGGTTKYLTKTANVPLTFSNTTVVRTLATESITPVGGTLSAITALGTPETDEFVTGVSATETRYKTQQITPVSGSETVAKAGSSVTVAIEGIKGYESPTKAGLETTSISYNTDAIKSYPGEFSKLVTGTAYGTGTTTVYSAGANVSVVNSVGVTTGTASDYQMLAEASVSSDGVLSFGYGKLSVGSTNVAGTRGSAQTVANGTSYTYATGSAATTGTGASFMTGLGTAVAASKATTTVATGGVTTGTQFITALGTATAASTASITPVSGTVSVPKAGTAVTVITNGTTNSGGVVIASGITSTSAAAVTALGTASTATVATAGAAKDVVTGASTTASVYSGIATSTSVFSGVSDTTASGAQAVVTALNANTGNKEAVDIAYTPEGSISGTQNIAAHTHTITLSHTATDATVTVAAHTHVITLSGTE